MSPKKEALIVIDMLNDFCLEGAPLEVPAARDIIPNILREAGRVRAAGGAVVYLCDAHDAEDPEFSNWPPHAVAGSPGAQVVDALRPQPTDRVIPKTTLLGFFKTDLNQALVEAGARTVTVTGCVTNICVMLVAHEAAVRGYKVRVPRDCVAGLDPEMHEFALRQMKEVIKADIV